MNVELLQKVKAAILAKPETYRQSSWCGTAHCIAGHAVAIAKPEVFAEAQRLEARQSFCEADDLIRNTASRLLKLGGQKSTAWKSLCHSAADWPEKFSDRYSRCNTPKHRARIAADRIDSFIESKGKR